jgi:acyl-coenzyme A synthetase/AMP-(fatty) acid ligase
MQDLSGLRMAKLVIIKSNDTLAFEAPLLNFQNSKDHRILSHIDEITQILASGVISCSFLEGWTANHIEYLNLSPERLRMQNALCSLLPTSATTGKPKMCVYSASTLEKITNVSYKEDFRDSRVYSSLSFSHSYMYPGTLLPALPMSELFIIDRSHNPLSFMKIIQQYAVDFIVSVPAQLKIWCKFNIKLPTVKKIYSAGGPFPYASLTELKSTFPNAQFINNYGATECGPRIAKSVIENEGAVNCFELIEGGEIKIQDGKAIFESPRLMFNYLGTNTKINELVLNDQITVKNNSIIVHGRVDNIINLGGKKVSYEHVSALCRKITGIRNIYFDKEKSLIVLVVESKHHIERYINELADKLMVERSYFTFTTQYLPKTFK